MLEEESPISPFPYCARGLVTRGPAIPSFLSQANVRTELPFFFPPLILHNLVNRGRTNEKKERKCVMCMHPFPDREQVFAAAGFVSSLPGEDTHNPFDHETHI
jgi:hypothetical protein